MKILIVVGACLKVNSSANLCHRSYINGFIKAGHNVTVISMSDKGQIIDKSIKLPIGAKYFEYDSSILLKLFNANKRKNLNKDMENGSKSLKTVIFTKMRKIILSLYGIWGYQKAWIDNVVKNFSCNKKFDLLISISSPVPSHVAANKLLKRKKIKCEKFCEIWEDPWQYDIYKETIDEKKLNIEEKITNFADKIIYVSPITMNIQKNIFKSSSDKMDWCPLPYYYKEETKNIKEKNKVYGYFGDYFPITRNLEPFYNAAKELGIPVNICGMPSTLFSETDNITINDRLPLNELKKYEDCTDVLVFVCNLKGGQIPGKIYQYSASNKYILFILDGTKEEKEIIKKYFEKFNRYIFCENNSEDIKRAINLIENNEVKNIENKIVDYFEPKNIAEIIINKVFN